VLGTAAYLSPEQARGEEAGPRADLYSLGVVTYQLISGRLPYEASSLSELALKQQRESPIPLDELNPAAPHALAQAVAMALSIDQRGRPPDALELSEAISEGARGVPPPGDDAPGFATSASTACSSIPRTPPRPPGSHPRTTAPDPRDDRDARPPPGRAAPRAGSAGRARL